LWSRGKELNCRSLGCGFEPWFMSEMPDIMHRSCPDNWFKRFVGQDVQGSYK
jgi:hypothetical protein